MIVNVLIVNGACDFLEPALSGYLHVVLFLSSTVPGDAWVGLGSLDGLGGRVDGWVKDEFIGWGIRRPERPQIEYVEASGTKIDSLQKVSP